MADDDPLTIQARTRFKEGVEAFDKGKFEEARISFLQAYSLKKHPAVLLNLAQSSAKSNHPLEAAKYFQQFLKEATTATPQQRKDAETGLADVRQKIGRIDVIAPAGTEISLDDQGKVGNTPMDPIDVDPGQHTVKSPTQNVTVVAVSGQKVEARFAGPTTAPPIVAPVPAPTAAPAEPVASSTPPPADADTGRAKRTNLLSPPANMTPVYVGLAAGGIGLATAIVFAAFKSDAQSKADDAANNIRTAARARVPPIPTQGACNNAAAPEFALACSTLKDNNDKVDTNAMIANVSLGVMGAGLVFAGAWYLGAAKRDDVPSTNTGKAPQRPLFTPYASAGGGGFSLSGEF